jgi:hypothetical protein
MMLAEWLEDLATTEVSSRPVARWVNAHAHTGLIHERIELIEVVEKVGSSEEWAFVLVRGSRSARFVQLSGRSCSGVSLEVGNARGVLLAVAKSQDAAFEICQICGTWVYWTLSTALLTDALVTQISESWLTNGVLPTSVELQPVRNGGGWIDGGQSRY